MRTQVLCSPLYLPFILTMQLLITMRMFSSRATAMTSESHLCYSYHIETILTWTCQPSHGRLWNIYLVPGRIAHTHCASRRVILQLPHFAYCRCFSSQEEARWSLETFLSGCSDAPVRETVGYSVNWVTVCFTLKVSNGVLL